MPIFLPAALMLMQVGLDPRSGGVPGVPEELRNRPPRGAAAAPRGVAATSPMKTAKVPARLAACLDAARTSPAAAIEDAETWLATASARGEERAQASHCLGVAQAESGDWTRAAASFAAALGAVKRTEGGYRARLGALAGNAALAARDAAGALALLDTARAAAPEPGLAAAIAIDRARALVELGRPAEAALALGDARAADPANGQAWLLSATLSRRDNDLAAAQTQIEKAAALAPGDPSVGLEAGVIAALAGRDAAARRSFESVIALSPDSDQAVAARRYLDQLRP